MELSLFQLLGRYRPVFNEALEKEIAEYALQMEARFYGLTLKDLKSLAFQLAERNGIDHPFNKVTMMAGEQWVKGFLKRHPNLSVRRPEATSIARAAAFNPTNVASFFKLLKDSLDEKKISHHRIFNVDETGITTVQARPSKIIALKGKHQVGTATSAERGVLITAVICNSASGLYVPPMLIFPRVRGKAELENGTPPSTLMAYHPSGWMQSHLFTEWFRHFLRHSKPTVDDPVLLILDGHSTHTKKHRSYRSGKGKPCDHNRPPSSLYPPDAAFRCSVHGPILYILQQGGGELFF